MLFIDVSMIIWWWDNDVNTMIYNCYDVDELLMYGCIDLTMQWYVGTMIYYIIEWII